MRKLEILEPSSSRQKKRFVTARPHPNGQATTRLDGAARGDPVGDKRFLPRNGAWKSVYPKLCPEVDIKRYSMVLTL